MVNIGFGGLNMNFLKGIVLSVLLALSIAFIFGAGANALAGGSIKQGPESWLYFAIIIPFVINFLFIYNFFKNKEAIKVNKEITV